MKTVLFTFLFTLLLFPVNCLNSKNPFAKFGYDVLVTTSSKGEFEEFHDQKEVVEIGSVLYNTKTKQIIGFVDENESALSSAITAMSIDPLCEKYYWISPYVYCANNPIKFIDPDGRDIWQIDVDGRLIGDVISNNDYDRIEIINQNGDIIGQTKKFGYGTIYQETICYTNGSTANVFEVKGGDNAENVFETFANPDKTTRVEWSHTTFGTASGTKDYVSTSHSGDTESSSSTLVNREFKLKNPLLRHAHNHAVNSPYPSGIWENTDGQDMSKFQSDISTAIKRTDEMQTKFGITPKFFMYNHKTGNYVPYTPKSTVYDPQFGIKVPGK